MALVLRFVDKHGYIRECFFDLAHVKDTSASTLKNEICAILSRHCLDVRNIRGQGYDRASNMCREWKGLQALFFNDCPSAYYVHCFAHRLQLALVAASREVHFVHEFFNNLTFIINFADPSCKRHDQLQATQATKIADMLSTNELESGKGANQIGTLKQATDTRWGSHFYSIWSLIELFDSTCEVLEIIKEDESTYSQRGDANAALQLILIQSFEFSVILHLMKEVMGITNILCQALHQKSQDILNDMNLVSSTKMLIQKLREDGWKSLLENVLSFCEKRDLHVPDLNAQYFEGRRRHRQDQITVEHHYHFDIFNAVIDFQLQELNNQFSAQTTDLLKLSSALDPKEEYKHLNIDYICTLAEKYYPLDFTEQERQNLKFQLRHFEYDVHNSVELQNLSSLSQLCIVLREIGKSNIYYLFDRLIRLVLTLPVSTATSERAFSAMKIIKTRLRNKMENEFLADNLVVNIEREIAETFSSDSILEDFAFLKERRA